MKINFKQLRNSIAVRIVAGLLLANLLAFVVATSYIDNEVTVESEPRVENVDILETGWQVMHWSYSLLEFFKAAPET